MRNLERGSFALRVSVFVAVSSTPVMPLEKEMFMCAGMVPVMASAYIWYKVHPIGGSHN